MFFSCDAHFFKLTLVPLAYYGGHHKFIFKSRYCETQLFIGTFDIEIRPLVIEL